MRAIEIAPLDAQAIAFVALFSYIVHFRKQIAPNDRHDATRGRVTRLALFSACMRDTTPRGLKARSMTVAPATAGRLRKPQNAGLPANFFQKMKRQSRKFFVKINKKRVRTLP